MTCRGGSISTMTWRRCASLLLRRRGVSASSSPYKTARPLTARCSPTSSRSSGISSPISPLQRPRTDDKESTWWPEIPFILLFGVATSVDLLQNRLPKSACAHLHGAQFDVAQGSTALEQVIVRAAVAAHDVPLRIGPSLLESLMNRQRNQVAGIQAFISSLKVRCAPRSSSPL